MHISHASPKARQDTIMVVALLWGGNRNRNNAGGIRLESVINALFAVA